MRPVQMMAAVRILVSIGLICVGVSLIAAQQQTGPQPIPLVPESLRGADLFRLYCATCHGRDGRGHGPVADSLRTPPQDLTIMARQNGGLFPRARVEAVLTGPAPTATHGSEDMPVWGPIFRGLDTSEARVKVRLANLVSYVESIQTK